MRKIILFFMILFFCACEKQPEVGNLSDEILAYTAKFQSDNPKILVLATYLNPIYQEAVDSDKNETILLNLYPKNLKIKKAKLNGDDVFIKELDDSDQISKFASFDIFWGDKFELKSSPKSAAKLNLQLTLLDENDRLIQASLDFQKIAKSLYWHSK